MSFFTPTWIAAVRAKADAPELAEARAALDRRAAAHHAAAPALPDRQAGYYHDFFCPQHAVQLVFDPHSPRRHVCPVDGALFRGEPFDSAWRWSVNDALSDAALTLAFRAFLHQGRDDDGAARDRDRAGAILAGYAGRYRTMPPAPTPHPNHPGVVTWSGLDESAWIIRLAWAYALLADTLPPGDAARVRDGLLRPAAEHLARVRWPEVHNVAVWNDAALVTLALALGDGALLAFALDGPLGLGAQLAGGVNGDGFWWEGSLSYHYYTLAALIWAGRALRAAGRAFDGDDTLRRMFVAPLAIAFPDLTLPAIHDCWHAIGLTGAVGHGIPDAAGFYEVAFGWHGDPAFAWVLRRNYADRPRAALEALLDGALDLPDGPDPSPGHFHAAESGLVVLRSAAPRDRQTYLLLKAGPSGGGHGHPDQLSIQLFAHGARLTDDPGTPGYGIGLNDTWYRQTASHSTALLDGRSQPGHEDFRGRGASGRIDHFRTGDEFAAASGSVSWTEEEYAGVQMRRTILWREDYFIDLFQITCPAPRRIDWVYQNLGVPVDPPAGIPAPGALIGDCGYAHVSGVARLKTVGGATLRWRRARADLTLFLPPDAEETFLGVAPANPASETLSVLVRRRETESVRFLAVFAPAPAGTAPLVRCVRWPGAAAPRELVVATSRGTERWTLDDDPGAISLRVSL